MAVPSINSITPARGLTCGQTLVEIKGVGFRATPSPVPAVDMVIGGTRAMDVEVVSTTLVRARLPVHEPGTVDVVVRNLDDAGDPIPGEVAVAAAAFTYTRPPLAVESDLTRLVRTLLVELKRQVLPEVVLTIHTDFRLDGEGAAVDLAPVAALPALALLGPELSENRFFGETGEVLAAEADGSLALRRPPHTVDLRFTLLGTSDHTAELLNLLAATLGFFQRNPYLELDRDPDRPATGRARYELELDRRAPFQVTSRPNESNVRSFSGGFVIRGFDLEEQAGLPGEAVRRRTTVASQAALQPPHPIGGAR